MQPLQAVHAVFLAALRKGTERLPGRGDGLSGVDLIRHGDLADNRVVGRVHQVNDLGSMGCDELAVDVGAIKGSYQSCGFVFVHFAFTLMTFSNLCPTSPSLSGPGYNFILAEECTGVTSKRRHSSCKICQRERDPAGPRLTSFDISRVPTAL